MNQLPKNLYLALALTLGISASTLVMPVQSQAASAYITPATGFIDESTFQVSVYVESTTAEPEIASAQLKITYPATANVVSVTPGEFDSYLDNSTNTTTRTISINAVNNAGNYKSGKVKVASLRFDAATNDGQVQLTITPDSEINGGGGEQLLTETVNGVYTLKLADTNAVGGGTTTTPPATTPVKETTTAVPSTGIGGGNQLALYLAISLGLVALGVVSYTNPLSKRA